MTGGLARERFVGCLVGLALGDALGAPLEFMARAQVAAEHGEVRELLGGGWLNVEPGEYTDDTQLALAIARSIIATGRIESPDIAARCVAWLRTGPKDVGNTTRTALRYHEQGVAWDEVGPRVHREMPRRSAGNGSLVRCTPVALFRARHPAALVADSAAVSRLTHAHPLAVWSAIALNLAIAELLHGRGAGMPTRVAAQIEEPQVRDVLLTAPGLERQAVRSGGYVLETLGAALWALENHRGFEEVVVAAVNLGDDADTVGAVAGALAGAREGMSALPDRWLVNLRDADRLADLALSLYRLGNAAKPDGE